MYIVVVGTAFAHIAPPFPQFLGSLELLQGYDGRVVTLDKDIFLFVYHFSVAFAVCLFRMPPSVGYLSCVDGIFQHIRNQFAADLPIGAVLARRALDSLLQQLLDNASNAEGAFLGVQVKDAADDCGFCFVYG